MGQPWCGKGGMGNGGRGFNFGTALPMSQQVDGNPDGMKEIGTGNGKEEKRIKEKRKEDERRERKGKKEKRRDEMRRE